MNHLGVRFIFLAVGFLLIGCQPTETEMRNHPVQEETETWLENQLKYIITENVQLSEKCGSYEARTAYILEVACLNQKVPPGAGNPGTNVISAFEKTGWVPVGHPSKVKYFASVKFAGPIYFSLLEQPDVPCESRILINTQEIAESEYLSTILRLGCDLKPRDK